MIKIGQKMTNLSTALVLQGIGGYDFKLSTELSTDVVDKVTQVRRNKMRALYWIWRARCSYWLARRLLKSEWCVRQPTLWRWMEGQFARLAALGDVAAQDFYGHILLFRGQGLAAKEEGMRLLRLAAAQGSGKAAFQLGAQALKGGLGQFPDAVKAKEYWDIAVQAGHPLAAVELVRLLENGGPGLSPDLQRAAELAARFSINRSC